MMRFQKRIAVLSDIHGNSLALKAVLDDINKREINSIVNLGDSLYGPLEPEKTAKILINLKIPSIRGNEDRILINPQDKEVKKNSTLSYVISGISSKTIQWLEKLSSVIEFEDMILFHGTLKNDLEYFFESVRESGISIKSNKDLLTQTSIFSQNIILCGHSHFPRSIHLKNGKFIVNPGSVGLQAYTDNNPYPHIIETGTPHARYCILHLNKRHSWSEYILVHYDWNKASELALGNGRHDWAKWLKYGKV
ncbi:MAG: metallophosphoesterase family protein [Candidatus Thorarchaeota archaeon]